MKTYEAVFKEGETEGIYALSVVDNPAMEDYWITLSEHPNQIELAEVDQKKRLLLGAALIPDKKIYRNIDGNEFYITFSADTIEKLAHNFFKQQMNNNSSLEHEIKLDGMSVVEGWIVEDTLKDKSANYGKQYPKGTFVTMMKVDNDEIWDKAMKGEIKGFSIDALLGLQEINLKQIEMNEETKNSIVSDVLNGVKALFNTEKEEPKQVALMEDGEKSEEVAEEKEMSEVETLKEALMQVLAEFKSDVDKSINDLKVELSTKDEAIEAKSKEVETLKAELNKQPEEEAVAVTPQVAELKKVSYGQNRPRTIQDRVFEGWE